MTTAVHEKPQVAAKEKDGPYRELSRGDVEIQRITVKAQHRKNFNEKAMKELSDNIKKVGVLEPILLRYADAGKNGYILIAGERRLRAAKMAGQTQIPSRVLDVTEDQAAEIQALENLHRADLGPVEEARAFKTLLDQAKYTVKQLGERMDKSEAYVYRAVRLLELPEKILNGIADGTLTAAHGHQILRALGEHWKLTSAYSIRFDGVSDAANFAEGSTTLPARTSGTFRQARQPGGSGGPFNSGNQDVVRRRGAAFQSSCFDGKSERYIQDLLGRAQDEAKKRGLTYIGAGKQQGY